MTVAFATSALVVALAGCEGCGSDSRSSESPSSGGAAGTATGGHETANRGQDPSARAEEGPAPVLVLRGEPGEDGQVVIVVENHGREAARLASALAVERQSGERWAPVEAVVGVLLRPDCRTSVGDCTTLAPGAALYSPPWRGQIGEAQCECERCAAAPNGRYRFVATSCGGAHRTESEGFALRR